MKTTLFILSMFLSLGLFGQSRYNIESTNFYDILQEDGFDGLLIFKKSKKTVDGIVYLEREPGLMSEGPLLMEMSIKKGIAHGIAKMWYESGELWSVGKLKKGKQHGKNLEWYKTGELKCKQIYRADKVIKQTCWDHNGLKIKCE